MVTSQNTVHCHMGNGQLSFYLRRERDRVLKRWNEHGMPGFNGLYADGFRLLRFERRSVDCAIGAGTHGAEGASATLPGARSEINSGISERRKS